MFSLFILHKLEETFGYYDVESGDLIDVIKTNPYPHEICINPSHDKMYIAEMGVRGIESEGPGGHTVSVYSVRKRKLLKTINTGIYDRPHGIAIHNRTLLVTSESTKHLLVFNTMDDMLLKAIYLNQDCAHMVAISPDGKFAYTANILSNSITEIDLNKYFVRDHIKVPERPEGMVFSPDSSLIYCVCREANNIAIIDRVSAKVIDDIKTGKGPVRIVISPDGNKVCVPLFHSSKVQFVDTKSRKVIDTISVGPHPAGVCLSPGGDLVFVSCEEENTVYVIDFRTHKILKKIKTGVGADAMICLYKAETE